MVLVDTSIWIDLFSKRPTITLSTEKLSQLVTCPPVIQEVLQGLSDH